MLFFNLIPRLRLLSSSGPPSISRGYGFGVRRRPTAWTHRRSAPSDSRNPPPHSPISEPSNPGCLPQDERHGGLSVWDGRTAPRHGRCSVRIMPTSCPDLRSEAPIRAADEDAGRDRTCPCPWSCRLSVYVLLQVCTLALAAGHSSPALHCIGQGIVYLHDTA